MLFNWLEATLQVDVAFRERFVRLRGNISIQFPSIRDWFSRIRDRIRDRRARRRARREERRENRQERRDDRRENRQERRNRRRNNRKLQDIEFSFRSISFDFQIGRNDADYDSFPLLIDYTNDGRDESLQATIDLHDQATAENALIEVLDPEEDE